MNLFIDIETIPSETMPDISSVKVPANYKDPAKIAEYQKANQEEEYKRQALDSMKGRIVCIGYSVDGTPPIILSGDEVQNLTSLGVGLGEAYSGSTCFVGWNIETFDIPWLWRKAIQYDLRCLRSYIPKGNKKLIIDLMRTWAADFKDYVKMSDCAKFLGIPHSNVSGADVYDLWKAGDIEAIEQHCREDIRTMIDIYRRIYE
jgi:hypothetical protein